MPVRRDTQLGKHYKCTGVTELCPERDGTQMVSLADGGVIYYTVPEMPHLMALSTQPLEWKYVVCDHS